MELDLILPKNTKIDGATIERGYCDEYHGYPKFTDISNDFVDLKNAYTFCLTLKNSNK